MRTVTAQQTAKKLKLIQGLGRFIIIVALTVIVMALANIEPARKADSVSLVSYGTIVLLLGVPFGLIGRIGAWWFHG
jgi:hypothetical protein